MNGSGKEILSRFIDGECTPEEHAALFADGDAQAASAKLRDQDNAVRDWFGDQMAEPMPAALAASVRTGFAARRARKQRGAAARWLVPVAAAVMIVLTGAVGLDYLIDRRVNQALENMRAERAADMALLASTVQDVLETRPSGTEVHIENAATGFGVTLVPKRTWKSTSGHWCREFIELFASTDADAAPVSTACRDVEGQWRRVRTELLAPVEPFIPERQKDL